MAERKEVHRARLLSVATRMFGRHGYHATTVPMIVKASGSSTGSFYFYFRNKEDVFAAVLETLGERLSAALNEAIAAAGRDAFSQMKAAVEGLVRFLAEHPEEARILVTESSGLGGRLKEVRRRILASHTRSVEQALTALMDRLPGLEPAVAASCWVGAAYEAVLDWLEQHPLKRLPPARLAEAIARFNLRGIGAPEEVL